MALIEMIPPEYWAQIRKELKALYPSEFGRLAADLKVTADTTTRHMKQRETPAERSARIVAEYDAEIKRKQEEAALIAAEQRRQSEKYKEAQRRAAERRRA